jgi:hypothetical protein
MRINTFNVFVGTGNQLHLCSFYRAEAMDEMFNEILEALAIPEAKRKDMLKQEMDVKWKMISLHQTLLNDDDASDATDWAEMLKEEPHYPT